MLGLGAVGFAAYAWYRSLVRDGLDAAVTSVDYVSAEFVWVSVEGSATRSAVLVGPLLDARIGWVVRRERRAVRRSERRRRMIEERER
jgi:hypothetical protein